MVRYSKGFLEFVNEEEGEIVMTDEFFTQISSWLKQYQEVEELDESDEKLNEQGIIINEDDITFDGKLTYSRFYKVVSDEAESMNNPEEWVFNDKNIEIHNNINFSKKNTAVFSSRLFVLKFYVLRKVDEVAFVTSRFVHCPVCGSNYVVPAAKIDFQQSYKCEKYVGDKLCKTVLKKFPARKMLPTYIYEISVEIKNKGNTEYKEFFLESFVELTPGFYSGMCFGRTEQKTNSFYFTCLTAKEEKSKHPFIFKKRENIKHNFFNLVESVVDHIERVGFVIDREKARLPVIIETIKKLNLTLNREINLDHSLYFGAPGIGKTYALTLLHHLFYSNTGFISGPRFTLPGLTGGQKEIYYQDVAKKKNVPGLFSNQAFVFDEINNAQFLSDDKATNLFKSVVLASSGTSSTVGGREFLRVSLIAGTGNYDLNHLRHYENKIKKIYETESKSKSKEKVQEQSIFLQTTERKVEVPAGFDFYAPLKNYGVNIEKELKTAVIKVRDDGNNYLTGFSKPLMERFYFSVLVHPKYDKAYLKQKKINVAGFLAARNSEYSNRELISQLFVPNLDYLIRKEVEETAKKFEDYEVEKKWGEQAREFLSLMAVKYNEFFSMFNRIAQVHVFTLFSLSLINKETELSFETRRIFEKIISLLHTPIDIKDFHTPDFDNFEAIGETKPTLMEIIRRYPEQDLRSIIDFDSKKTRTLLAELETNRRIKKVAEYKYKLDETKLFTEVDKDDGIRNK